MNGRTVTLAALFGSLLLVAYLSACLPSFTPVPPSPQRVENYTLGQEMDARVGAPMVTIESRSVRPAFVATQDFVAPEQWGVDGRDTIATGDRFTVVGRGSPDDEELYLVREDRAEPRRYISIRRDGSVFRGWTLPEGFLVTRQRGDWPEGRVFRESPRPSSILEAAATFRAELLYTGRVGDDLRIMYREFSEDLARPAFFQELHFDLSEGDLVTFRSLRIRVLEASNSSIQFVVLEDGGLPWWPGSP